MYLLQYKFYVQYMNSFLNQKIYLQCWFSKLKILGVQIFNSWLVFGLEHLEWLKSLHNIVSALFWRGVLNSHLVSHYISGLSTLFTSLHFSESEHHQHYFYIILYLLTFHWIKLNYNKRIKYSSLPWRCCSWTSEVSQSCQPKVPK